MQGRLDRCGCTVGEKFESRRQLQTNIVAWCCFAWLRGAAKLRTSIGWRFDRPGGAQVGTLVAVPQGWAARIRTLSSFLALLQQALVAFSDRGAFCRSVVRLTNDRSCHAACPFVNLVELVTARFALGADITSGRVGQARYLDADNRQ